MERGTIISKIFFCWLVPFLSKGLKKEIDENDMYETRKPQKSTELGNKLESAWKKELNKSNPSLTKSLFIVFRKELALYALIHLFNECVKISQPILIFKLLSFFQTSGPRDNKGEIFAYAATIVLMSFVNVTCLHSYQMWIMALGMKIRVAACSLIYRKSLKLSRSALAETTIGQMVNLLSNDVGSVMAKLTSKYRIRTATRTDERVRLMNEIISGIQVIKMYTWEKPFEKLVELVRRKEIDQIKATSTIRALTKSCHVVLSRIAVYLCILTYILTGNTLTATYAYTVASFYGVLRVSITMFVPQALTQFAETRVSVKRIQQFLLYDELSQKATADDTQAAKGGNKMIPIFKTAEVGINLSNMFVRWSKSSPENTLQRINFRVAPEQLVAVVGPVGGGKTTLLHAILKELTPSEGSVDIRGIISYASQEPWVFGGSVRQNILFGQNFEPKKYGEVIRVCALQRDLSIFPHGDRTLVGERGVTLSGGQRARINLARAVYKDADIYLLDDPLSAVDAHVGKQLFEDCICGYLKNKCVVLVTHQLHYLKNTQCIYLLEDGEVRSSGTYQELKDSDSDFTKLLTESKAERKNNAELPKLDQEDDVDNEESPMTSQEKEQRATGKITWHVYRSYLRAGGSWFKTFGVLLAFVLSQTFGSMIDYFLTIWVNLEQWRKQNGNGNSLPNKLLVNGTSSDITPPPSGSSSKHSDDTWDAIVTTDTLLVIYSCLLLLTVFTAASSHIAFFRHCMRASIRLHNAMFGKIVYSSMRFFNTNPSGRILNRFSKDIGAVDENLPLTFVDTVGVGLLVVSITFVIGTLNPWIMIPTVIILVIFYFLRLAFLASSRNIKRIEAITRSPVYTHLAASLQGLTTIRAFGAEKILAKEFDNYQDAHTSAYFMYLSANRGFGFWLDVHCIIYIFLVTISILFIQNESFGGNVGLSLTQAMTLSGMFQWALRQWSELENQMTSVERIQEYADISPEHDTNARNPQKSWPERGKLEFVDLSLRYSVEDPFVLQKINVSIEPREKVGIVGRTGAGKSSLIQALFRLADIEGSILIDGVDTKSVPLKILRSNISIIPQEPVLFSGTLRKNFDPFDDYNDEILWDALEQVELKQAINELPEGLDSKMAEGGSNFSVGQRQLLCLARAIVRSNKILVLDEATANVDPQTDALIQTTIRQKFANCTVLTIAHRLHTIMDSDKILVMDAGEAVEFDHPYTLLQKREGAFYRLVEQTGAAMAEDLRTMAQKT
ncbi:hypothetical protein JTB14_021541 [Gonioctena quinquepunctata]|nr:hypothetical protein JTB14_021541 [Gonioctena quinquepunctata]